MVHSSRQYSKVSSEILGKGVVRTVCGVGRPKSELWIGQRLDYDSPKVCLVLGFGVLAELSGTEG